MPKNMKERLFHKSEFCKNTAWKDRLSTVGLLDSSVVTVGVFPCGTWGLGSRGVSIIENYAIVQRVERMNNCEKECRALGLVVPRQAKVMLAGPGRNERDSHITVSVERMVELSSE